MRYLENDEARMVRPGLALNDEGMPNVEFKASRLGFVSSCVIRISSLAAVVAAYMRSHHARAATTHSTKFHARRNTGLWRSRPAECHSAGRFPKLNSGQNVRWAHRLKVCVPLLHYSITPRRSFQPAAVHVDPAED
jgi:hypothetical protein